MPQISFSDPDVQRCPFAAYEAVRAKGPVYIDPVSGFYIVTGYDLIRQIAADPARFSSITGQLLVQDSPQQAEFNAVFEKHGYLPVSTLVVSDPPDHSFYRSLVDKAFTPSRVKQMEDYLQGIVEELIDSARTRGTIEFHSEIANTMTLSVIADQLGVPRADLATFRRWTTAVIDQADPSRTFAEQLAITHTLCELQRYIADKAEVYRAKPRECMLSDLVHAEVNGRGLTTHELIAIVTQILVAGNDTTTNAMASAMIQIIRTPGLEEKLRANPHLIPDFIEEVLRLNAPVQGLWRRATRATEIGGIPVPADAIIVIKFGAGNRDARHFPKPDEMDLERNGLRRHLTFGAGPHHCIGNQLARGELRVAIATLLRRLRNFRLAPGHEDIAYTSHFFNFGPSALHLSFDPI